MKTFWKYFFLLLSTSANAQNLVPNYSFEQYDTCPSGQDQIQYANGWSKYSISITTPDYYNACAPSVGFGVPQSGFCNQQENRNCDAYAAVITFDPNGYREHIGIQINEPLIIGQQYFISFITVMCEFANTGNQYGMPSDNIGIRLSTVAYNTSSPCPIDNWAHLYTTAVLNDSTNWNRISGSIIADSAYNYIIIGNFFDNISTDTLHYNCPTCLNLASYYLVDDLCLSTDSSLCNGEMDEWPCSTITDVVKIDADEVNVYPNPTHDFLSISLGRTKYDKIEIYNVMGKMIYTSWIDNEGALKINMANFSSGIYFLKILNEKTETHLTKKISKL